MITPEEFKKQMREFVGYTCPKGSLLPCKDCPCNMGAKVGIVDREGRIDTTFCMSLFASYLDRQWEKKDEMNL